MAAIRMNRLAERQQQIFARIRQRRVFRPRVNIVNSFSELELLRRYRFDSASIAYICELLQEDLQPASLRNRAITVEQQVLTALRYYATGSMQLVLGDTLGLSQPSVSRIIWKVSASLTRRAADFIKMPITEEEKAHSKSKFYNIARFPGIIGLVDGTHIRISAPSAFEPEYVNRKSYHSINVQVVCDSEDKFINVVARWPGATHDSRILRNSSVWESFESGFYEQGTYILGDSGYPCKDWLLTPYAVPRRREEERYNRYYFHYNLGLHAFCKKTHN